MNIAEAKSKLSELVARAEAGEDVVIARNGKPAARITAVEPPRKVPRRLGAWDHLNLDIPDSVFFDRDPELEEAVENSMIFPLKP
ncbi:type II toxin-antitoxin system prevent-host-death family antitoxin [Brevundimonas sp.]|uniref:type II toxin-antitoxin system Phd/YefM family antitoxin n=1 Tax=Brevundimonas sp. TaxID=1871086 RepID=UPI002AB8D340|nr:type II toxin-antitoxin system prevent-host-death family antitoxin [Brevundimonas sp.]MDZ4363333.1 type II toxin-antitoxin system prevent-host-death family antitoxin [Brevundimonas sp.]